MNDPPSFLDFCGRNAWQHSIKQPSMRHTRISNFSLIFEANLSRNLNAHLTCVIGCDLTCLLAGLGLRVYIAVSDSDEPGGTVPSTTNENQASGSVPVHYVEWVVFHKRKCVGQFKPIFEK